MIGPERPGGDYMLVWPVLCLMVGDLPRRHAGE